MFEAAKRIKAVFFDVDGVLTNGQIIYGSNGLETKQFNVKDGFMARLLLESGYVVGALTGRASEAVMRRCAELSLTFCEQGAKHKWPVFCRLCQEHGLAPHEVAYIGDDWPDLQVLLGCGLPVCPADACAEVRSRCLLVTKAGGGAGVLREAGEYVLKARQQWAPLLERYLNTRK